MSKKISVAFRPYATTDVNFIISSWLKGWQKAPINFGIDTQVYFKTAEVYIKDTLERAGAIIACDPADPNEIFGYVCAEYLEDETIIHWIYVKFSFRGYGIGDALYRKAHPHEDRIPFSTSYCPRYEDLDSLYRKSLTKQDELEKHRRILKGERLYPKLTISYGSKELAKVQKNSFVYISKADRRKVIYSPFLMVKVATCQTTPIATLIT